MTEHVTLWRVTNHYIPFYTKRHTSAVSHPKISFHPKRKNYKNCHISAASGVNGSMLEWKKTFLWFLQSNFTPSFLHERCGGSFFMPICSLSNNSSAYILPPTVLLWSDSSDSRLCKDNLTVCDQNKISDHWLNCLCGSIKGVYWFTHTPAIHWGRSPSAFTSRWHK